MTVNPNQETSAYPCFFDLCIIGCGKGLSEKSNRNNTPRVTKITFGVIKILFGVIENTFGETQEMVKRTNAMIHNHEVAGSIPAPATLQINELQRCSSFFFCLW